MCVCVCVGEFVYVCVCVCVCVHKRKIIFKVKKYGWTRVSYNMVEQAFSLIREHGADDNDVDDDYVVFRSFTYTKFLSGIFSLHDIHSRCVCYSMHLGQ